ncbi:transcriptional regulator with XRE-family HTH domain [Spinactinospora alkalitolerans]|uniref:Transcriptional regulator with XRE-family HTH domain n=1 Tax=Spinactinospora alkalitolerans TaxID=687207 RepID=A0A852U0N6_9ACTN|nr:helix-turn-helix transcriptional regulator [Spinactinospora alkalitolerans]NYE47570.1 transcriptional regulator with XRE-family HTH domain [Spinactinospora alkalitolerans]
MVDKVNPQWLKFGKQVRLLRERHGLSQDQLSRSMTISPAMLSAIERGIRGCKPEHAEQIDRALNTGGRVRRLWEGLPSGNGFPDWFRDVVELQREASEIREYHPLLIPGLLQTEEYARTILRDGQPTDSAAEIDEQVRARMDRQSILSSDRPPLLLVVLDETLLRRPIGGREIMGRQLEHLLEASAIPHVVIQVVPMATEHHPGLSGAFTLITVPNRGVVLYMETRISGTPVDDPDGVEEYVRLYGELRGVALPPAASRGLIEKVRGEFQ